MCKKGDYWSIRHTKEECNEVREGFKRYIHQYLVDNDIDNFNKNIILTAISGNFFYNDYGVEHFMTLNRLIPIKTAKNIVIFMNNNAFVYSLTGSIEPGGTEPSNMESSTVRRSNKVNTENLIVDIDFFDYHFNDNG